MATTFVAGVHAVRKGLGKPIGSLTQMGTVRLEKRPEKRAPMIKDFVPLANLDDLVFGGWDIFEDNMYESAIHAGVLDKGMLDQIRPELESIEPMHAVFDPDYVKRLNGTFIKKGRHKMDLADQLREDIQQFKTKNKLDRMVMVWCGSTEVYIEPNPVRKSLEAFERGLRKNDPAIAPSMTCLFN